MADAAKQDTAQLDILKTTGESAPNFKRLNTHAKEKKTKTKTARYIKTTPYAGYPDLESGNNH